MYQENSPVTKRSIKKQIVEAQTIAKDAVKADNFHCYEEAIILYETAINEIKRILQIVENEKINNHNDNVISDTDFILLQNIHSAYFDRLNFLKVNTDNNYTSNLKNIEVDTKNYNINMRQPNIPPGYGMAKNNMELQRMKKIQEYQTNLELFETMDFYNMPNNMNYPDPMQKKTQNMNELSEMIYEDPYYNEVKPPSYTKNNFSSSSSLKNKYNYFEDDLGGNSNNNIFKSFEPPSYDVNPTTNTNKLNNYGEVKNGIEPIPSNNIFNKSINNNDLEDYSINDKPIPMNRNFGPNVTKNPGLMNNTPGMITTNPGLMNNSTSTANMNTMSSVNSLNTMETGKNSPGSKITTTSIPSTTIPPPEKPHYNNTNFSSDNSTVISTNTIQAKPQPLQVQIPKRDPSLSRNGGKNVYAMPFSSKLISQPTPTTPTTAYVPFGINDQMSVSKDTLSYSNSLPYSIEYLLMEQPHDVPKPEMLPQKLILRPFWLMRLLSRSMYEGGYLTPRVYVPKQLWYQKGVKYVAIETKYQACINLLQHLQKIRNTNIENPSELYDVLRILESETDAIQNMLSKKLKYIDEILELGAVVSLDKRINMTLLWKYGFELNLMRELPTLEGDSAKTSGKLDNMMDPLYSVTSHFHGEDYMMSRNGEMSGVGMRSNNYGAQDDLIKSTKSITDITNGKVPETLMEEDLYNPKGPSAYSISSISINSNVTSSSKLAHTKSRLSRSMDKFTNKKGEKVGDISGYIEVLISLFNQAQFFVDWINYIEAKGKANPSELQYVHIHNQLSRLSYFFGRVICTFVLKDFEMLLDRYLYKLRQNVF